MDESKATDAIDHDRRQLLGTAAMGIAVAGAASLLPALPDFAGEALAQPSNQGDKQMASKGDAIRPFSINFPEEALVDLRRRIDATKWPEQEQVPDAIAGRAARDDPETRAPLGDRLRLAQGRGAPQRPAAVHHRDRWTRHSFHSRSFQT